MSVEVLTERVDRLRTDLDGHIIKDEETHEKVYDKLELLQNRLPVWATLAISVLTGLLGVSITAAIMR